MSHLKKKWYNLHEFKVQRYKLSVKILRAMLYTHLATLRADSAPADTDFL